MNQVFNYKWYLKNGYPAKNIDKHNSKVFSTFACGGGSTMGYKLAGYDVIGANDIDPKMAAIYKINHNPKHYFLESIVDLTTRSYLPEELFNLDILDGSPPCSTFSTAGSREKSWKVDKKFREGQKKQVLSDLFFEWIKLVDKLKPKIAIAENVKGMLTGNAKAYTQLIVKELNDIGYEVQVFLLNAASMGVPQKRDRVFFICHKKGAYPKLDLSFNEKVIPFKNFHDDNDKENKLTDLFFNYWKKAKPGQVVGKYISHKKGNPEKPLNTICARGPGPFSYKYPRSLNKFELCCGGSFPLDYDFCDVKAKYVIGMSVPPIMMAQLSYQIYKQWIKPHSVKRNGEECKDFT